MAKKILGIKGISPNDITKHLSEEQKKFVKENVLNNTSIKEILKNSIQPIEKILINYSVDLLRSISSLLDLENNPNSNRLNKQINNSIKFINTGNSLNTLKNELKSLRHVDRYLEKPKNNLYYDGELFKIKEGFKPINELLKLFKPLKHNSVEKNVLGETDINFIVQEAIEKNKYFLLPKFYKKFQR